MVKSSELAKTQVHDRRYLRAMQAPTHSVPVSSSWVYQRFDATIPHLQPITKEEDTVLHTNSAWWHGVVLDVSKQACYRSDESQIMMGFDFDNLIETSDVRTK